MPIRMGLIRVCFFELIIKMGLRNICVPRPIVFDRFPWCLNQNMFSSFTFTNFSGPKEMYLFWYSVWIT